MKPRSIPNASPRTFAIGTTQFVVHDAFDTIFIEGLNSWSFTPTTNVPSTLVAGAEMTTRGAPPPTFGSRSIKGGKR